MVVFDTHAHLNDEAFRDDVDGAVARAAAKGVPLVVVPGFDLESSRLAVRLAETHPGVYAAVGVHPHEAGKVDGSREYLDELRRLAAHPKVVAVGEIGLDYHYDFAPRDSQKRVFAEQLALARELGKPAIIHDREAHEDTLAAVDEASRLAWRGGRGEQGGRAERDGQGRLPAPGVMHCFSGSLPLAREVVARGFYLGVAGPVTFANAKKPVEVFQSIPLERLVVETDSPYLAPVPLRGKRNEPSFVTHVVAKLAVICGLEAAEVARATTANGLRLFGLGGGGDRA